MISGSQAFGGRSFTTRSLLVLFAMILCSGSSPAQQGPELEIIDVVAAIPRDFPPQYGIGEDGRPQGFAIEVMDAIAGIGGLRVTYRIEDNWAEVQNALGDGHADLIPNIGITDERMARFAFTQPLEAFPVSIFVRSTTNDIRSLDDLAGKTVAVVKGNVAEDLLADRPLVNIELFDDPENALFPLLSGKVDAMIYPQPTLLKIVQSIGVDRRIKAVGEPLIEIKRAIAVHRENTALLDRLRRATDLFVDSEAYRRIYVTWYRDPMPYWTPARVGWLMGGFLILTLAAMAIWHYVSMLRLNRRLVESHREWSRAEEALRQANLIVENSPVVLFKWRPAEGWPVQLVSKNITQFGYSQEQLMSGEISFESLVHPDDARRVEQGALWHGAHGTHRFRQEYRIVTRDGEVRWVDDRSTIERDESGEILHYEGVLIDVTELRLAEMRLRQTEKLDAIGAMASGVAHDFNNMLAVVIGNLGLLKRQIADDAGALTRVETIERSAQRAADLTRQLLGFSRRQPVHNTCANINTLVRNMRELIGRSVTPEVEVAYQLADPLPPIEVDAGDFENAVLNLILNARDAMPGGGKVIIETTDRLIDTVDDPSSADIPPGRYVQLTVTDNGAGIPAELHERIFEPFFTTKAKGKGTGLGLSMVFGFVKRSSGYVDVCSGKTGGTRMRILFPAARTEKPSESNDDEIREPDADADALTGGTETILVVDDEPDLRALVVELLQNLGYRVVAADNGPHAIEILTGDPGIDLLFSDIVMPGGINGFELAEQATARRPGLKVLLTSGFVDAGPDHLALEKFAGKVLTKPYSDSELATRLRSLLDT